jgi:hypothetical protein
MILVPQYIKFESLVSTIHTPMVLQSVDFFKKVNLSPNYPLIICYFAETSGYFAYVAFCLQIFCRQNNTLFGILCHLAYGHFAYRNRLHATQLRVKLPISVAR